MSVTENNVMKKYKLVPPDGGWGYMILIAVIINFSTATMFQPSFGLLYNEFMKDIGMTSTHFTMMMGIFAMCSALSGFVTSPLLSIMSMRTLSLIATLMFDIGILGCVFVNSIFAFYICIGILQGTGIGIIFNTSFTVLNDYFLQKRLMAISISQTVIALITMVTPMCVKWCLDEYGFRGTILLVLGITLNNLIAVALIQPVEHHMKKVEMTDSELNALLENEAILKPVLNINDVEKNISKSNEVVSVNEDPCMLKKIFNLLVDESLRKTFLLSCVSLGPALCLFADLTYTLMLPQALFAAHWTKHNVALALSLSSFGDLATRIVFIFCSTWLLKLGSEELYVLGAALGLIARLGTLWSKSLIANIIYITLTGVSHCPIVTLVPVVIADAVPQKMFTAAMGIYMMLYGVMNLILGPAIGAVRDLSESYGAALYLIASCFGIVVLFWSIEICYKKNEHKRLQRKEYLRQKKINKG